MTAVDISVVIPVGRVDALLDEELDAVLAQDGGPSFEVVLSVNTPSPEAWQAIEERLRRRDDPRLRAIDSSDQRGAAHARNAGAAAAAAPLLAFCDADDVVEVGWLHALVDALADADAVSGYVSESRFSSPEQQRWRPPATPHSLPTFLGVPYLLSGNLAVRREAFDAVRGFDTTLTRCEDIAISWDLLKLGYRLAYAPDAVLHYRHREGLWAMMHQHYLYGRGMSEVLVRHGRPSMPGDDPSTSSAKVLFRPNNQSTGWLTVPGVLRRGSIAAGRLVGLAGEGIRRRRGGQ